MGRETCIYTTDHKSVSGVGRGTVEGGRRCGCDVVVGCGGRAGEEKKKKDHTHKGHVCILGSEWPPALSNEATETESERERERGGGRERERGRERD